MQSHSEHRQTLEVMGDMHACNAHEPTSMVRTTRRVFCCICSTAGDGPAASGSEAPSACMLHQAGLQQYQIIDSKLVGLLVTCLETE